MNSFKSCHPRQLRDLTHPSISFLKSMDLKALAGLQDLFPVLQEFYLHVSEKSRPSGLSCKFSEIRCPFDRNLPPPFPWIDLVHSVDLTDLYTIPLPSKLVSLSIQWTSHQDAGVMPDLIAAKDNLLPRLPSLRRLWLYDFSKGALLWSRTGSRSEERCTVQEGE
jgi:hypothetical protein